MGRCLIKRMTHCVCVAAILLLVGCGATVQVPSDVKNPTDIFLVKKGGHISLVLPDEQPDNSWEYVYGEYEWYAKNRTNPLRVVGVLMFDTPGALGRRELNVPAEKDALVEKFDRKTAEDVRTLTVNRQKMASVRDRLDQKFAKKSDQAVVNPKNGITFIPSDIPYSGSNTCNTMVAKWLREMGVEVEGSAVTSDFSYVGSNQ